MVRAIIDVTRNIPVSKSKKFEAWNSSMVASSTATDMLIYSIRFQMCLFIQCWGPSSTLRYNGIESSVKTPCTQCLTHLTARCGQLDRMLHDVTDCCSMLCMLKKRLASVESLKASQVPHTMQRTWQQFCQLCELCRFARFAAKICCALCPSLRQRSHNAALQGAPAIARMEHSPSPPSQHFACVNVRQCARWKCQLDPIFTAVQANGCAVFQAPAKWLEMLELHQPYLQKSSNGMWATQWRIRVSNCNATASREWKETRICLAQNSCRTLPDAKIKHPHG